MSSSHVTLHGGYLDVKIKGRLGDRYRRRYISLLSNAMLGRRWLEVQEHNGSLTASERIELQDDWMVAERMSKGNKRCVTDVVINGIIVITFTSPLPQERAEWMRVLENLKKTKDDITCSVTVCQSTGATAMGLSGDYLLKLLDNNLVLHTPSGVGVCQWLMEDVHLFTMSTDNSLLLHASHKLNEGDNDSNVVQLEFTTDTGVAALQLVKDWSCRLVQSCDTHEKLIKLLRNNKSGEQYSSNTLPRQHNPDEPTCRNSHFSRASRLLSSLRQKSTRSKRRPLSRVAAPPTFTPAPLTRRPYSIAGLPVDFSDQNDNRSTPPVVPPPILPRPPTQQFTGDYVDDEIAGYRSESECSSVDHGVISKPKPYLELLPDGEDSKVGAVSSREEATSTSQATIDTTTPPTRRHSLVHRHSSAAYAMEHAPILTHPALDTVEKPPLPPRTYKSGGSTDSLSSDSSPHLPVQSQQSNHTTNTITSDSEPEETFVPLKPKPNMRFKVDVSQRKPPFGGSNTLPSSSSDGLQQTSIPEEREIVSHSSSPPPPLPPKPAAASCTCTCHHHGHHHDHQKTDSKRRRSHNRKHSKFNMVEGGRFSDRRSQSSLTPQSSITSHSSINSQPSFGSDTSGIQEDHEFDSAIAMLHNAFQSLSDAASNIGTEPKQQGSFHIDLDSIPPQPEPLAYLEPLRMSTSPPHVQWHRDQSVPSKTSQKLCRLYPPSLITSSNSSTVFASHVRHH